MRMISATKKGLFIFKSIDAKILLRNQSQLTVLEILYQVGFNSKSSFYTAFKKKLSSLHQITENQTLKQSPTFNRTH